MSHSYRIALQATLQGQLKALAPGLTARSVIEKFESMQMVDVILPTTGGLGLRLPRYTEPSREIALLLARLKLKLPPQPKPELMNKPQTDTAPQAFQASLEKLTM